MFDILFGWRKASKCKSLIKRVQCRLKLLKTKRFAIVKQLKEDIAQLLKDGYDHVAFNRLEQLYEDESMLSVYEMLDNFSEFVILNLSYIRRHKDIPNDINEAVSTLIFASARCGDLPELRLLRELFSERYGMRFANAAVELHSGNLVNNQVKEKLSKLLCEQIIFEFANAAFELHARSLVNNQVKEKLTTQLVPEQVKNRILDEIVQDYFFKPGPLALKHKPEFQALEEKEARTSSNCSIVLQSPVCCTTYYPELSMIYLDEVEEFKSPTKQDQRFFVFKMTSLSCKEERTTDFYAYTDDHDKALTCIEWKYSEDENLTRKSDRKRSISCEKQTTSDFSAENYYQNQSYDERKCRKKIEMNHFQSQENQLSVEKWKVEEIEEMGVTRPLPQTPKREVARSTLLPVVKIINEEYNGRVASTSPRFVHPKLPDYDEIVAEFMELKRAHQQTKCKS